MGRILLEGGIVILLVLLGISIFIPSSNGSVENVIVEFEGAVESGEIVSDGVIDNVEVSEESNSNFISKVNCKIANALVNGLNSMFEIGIRFLRKVIN